MLCNKTNNLVIGLLQFDLVFKSVENTDSVYFLMYRVRYKSHLFQLAPTLLSERNFDLMGFFFLLILQAHYSGKMISWD